MIVWDCWTGNKTQIIPLRSAWVMTSVFSPSGNFVACGGMDNMLTMYDLNNRDSNGLAKMVREVAGYEGFLSSARFLDDENIITGSGKTFSSLILNLIDGRVGVSGDMKVMHFKVETGQKVFDIQGHNGDVAALSLNPKDPNMFMTGSVDR